MTVDQPDLEDRIYDSLLQLDRDREAIQAGIGRCVARQLGKMARMGWFLEQEVGRRVPNFPTREGVIEWREYLPPLAPELENIVQTYGADVGIPPLPSAEAVEETA